VVQTAYDIVKAHGGDIKVETKEGEGVSLLFNCQLFEARISKIKRLHG